MTLPLRLKSDAAIPIWAGIGAALVTLIPPSIVGTDSSALALQSLQHWMDGAPDRFEVLHMHWLWLPRLIAFLTQDAFVALVIFRALISGLTIYRFAKVAERMLGGGRRTPVLAAAMLALNVVVLYLSHTFASQLLTLFVAVWMLYLFTSEKTQNHKLAALIFGLSLLIGLLPWLFLLMVVTVGFGIHHTTYTPRASETYQLLGLGLLGLSSYILVEIFFFGTAHLWNVLNPERYNPREISLLAQGLVIGLVSVNALFLFVRKEKGASIVRDFQPLIGLLSLFLLSNLLSRADALHDAIVLLPCIILIGLDRLQQRRLFAMIYLAVNLSLFIFLPNFQPNPQIAMPSERRSADAGDVSVQYYASADLFSFAKLEEQAAGEAEVKALLATARLDSTLVLVTPGTDYWFDAATLGTMYPGAKFGWFYGYPINMVRVNALVDTAFIRPSSNRPHLAGLFSKSYAKRFIDSSLPPGVPVRESARFQYIDTRGNQIAQKALIDRIIFLQYKSFRH